MPLSDGLRKPEEVPGPEKRYPLEVAFCTGCSLVQILEEVDPEVLFGDDYPYFSSFSDQLLEHSKSNVLSLIDERGLAEDSLVIELASNDGYLLQFFVENGVPVLGIDPAEGPAQAAQKRVIPTAPEGDGQRVPADGPLLSDGGAENGERAGAFDRGHQPIRLVSTSGPPAP